MRLSSVVTLFLVVLLSIPEGLLGQVSRVTVAQPASGTVPAVLPTTVATAPLPGLQELSLPSDDQVFVRESSTLFDYNGKLLVSSGSAFRREVRNGRLALVETKYEVIYQKTRIGMSFPDLKATTELIHPGDSKLIYTGPWGGGWTSLSSYYVYLFRPMESPPVVSRPRTTTVSFAELNTGTTALARSNVTPRVIANPSQLLPSTASCEVPTTLGGGGLGNLVCLLLKDGQGMTLPTSIKLFRRQLVTEVWSGDKLIDQSSGLVVRDGTGRHWLLESKGYR